MLIYGILTEISMQQATIQKAQEKILEMTHEQHGVKLIGLGCYALDFKNEYVFLGFTKKGDKAILGRISIFGPNGIKYSKKIYARIEERQTSRINEDNTGTYPVTEIRLVTDGYRYSETLFEINEKSLEAVQNRIAEFESSHKVEGGTHNENGFCPTCEVIEKLQSLEKKCFVSVA